MFFEFFCFFWFNCFAHGFAFFCFFFFFGYCFTIRWDYRAVVVRWVSECVCVYSVWGEWVCVSEKPSQAWMKWVVGKGFFYFVFCFVFGIGWLVCKYKHIYTHTHTWGNGFQNLCGCWKSLQPLLCFLFWNMLSALHSRCSSRKGLRQICTAISCDNPSMAMAWGLSIVHSVQNTLHTTVFRVNNYWNNAIWLFSCNVHTQLTGSASYGAGSSKSFKKTQRFFLITAITWQ